MKILITGSSGMLGRALCEELADKDEVVGLDVVELTAQSSKLKGFVQCDITDREKTMDSIASIRPDVVLHTAAYTDVDGCQSNEDKARQVNARGTETVALACQKCGAFLYYISTDFVFDGEKKSAYTEEDQPQPINIYGQSKLLGERYIQSALREFILSRPQTRTFPGADNQQPHKYSASETSGFSPRSFIIVRTSWLFGRGGKNFVDTILCRAQNEREIKVVNDRYGSPTYVKDLARAIKKLIDLSCRPTSTSCALKGIYHITNSGSCSWYELALKIKEITGLNTDILPISSAQYSTPTRRPKLSILDNSRYQQDVAEKPRHWQEALREYLQEVLWVY